MFKKQRINSMQDFINICDCIESNQIYSHVWFRGQSSSSSYWRLAPSIGRENVQINLRKYYEEWWQLIKACKNLEEFENLEESESWAFAQHYGLKTHLLDWTTDKNIAIYFATKDFILGKKETSENINPAIYVYARKNGPHWHNIDISDHARALDGAILDKNSNVISENTNEFLYLPNGLEHPVNNNGIGCFTPDQNIIDRLKLQKGCFTVHQPSNLCLIKHEESEEEDLLLEIEITNLNLVNELYKNLNYRDSMLYGERETKEIQEVNSLFEKYLNWYKTKSEF